LTVGVLTRGYVQRRSAAQAGGQVEADGASMPSLIPPAVQTSAVARSETLWPEHAGNQYDYDLLEL
jgi:hypothetical protein